MIEGFIEDSLLLELELGDGDTGKFPRVRIYDAAAALQTTIDLVHVAFGLYQGAWASPPALGHFSAVFIVYNDAGHTVVSNRYEQVSERVRIVAPAGGIA